MAKSRLAKANEEIAEAAVGTYREVEETVVGGYKKIEDTVVGGYRKIEDAFVDRYLTRDGESVGEARARLHAEQAGRQRQHDSHATQGADPVRQAPQQTMEQVRRAQETGCVPERKTKAN